MRLYRSNWRLSNKEAGVPDSDGETGFSACFDADLEAMEIDIVQPVSGECTIREGAGLVFESDTLRHRSGLGLGHHSPRSMSASPIARRSSFLIGVLTSM